MAIEQEYIDIYLNQDGSLSEKSVGNVFQFTNDFIGVRMLCSYSSEDVLAFINIQLPNGSVLGEKGMMAEAEIVEEGTTWYPYTYVFPEIVTSQSGSKFSAVVVIAFRLLDKESMARSLNSTLVPITVQPSIRGLAAEINDPTAYQELLSKINQLSVNKQNVVDQTLETSSKRVPGAINEVNAKAQKAAEDAALAVETANRAESNINEAVDAANEAVRVAEGVDGKATEALENSAEAAAAAEKSAADAEAAKEAAESISGTAQQALTVAQEAKEIAEGIDGKATEALEKSTEAMAAVAKEIEEHTIVTSAWTALSGSAPYTYFATVTVSAEISQTSVIELYNNNAVLFANYGFAIGAVSGQTVTVYSIGLPTESVTLTIQVGG